MSSCWNKLLYAEARIKELEAKVVKARVKALLDEVSIERELRELAEYAGELAFQRDQALRLARSLTDAFIDFGMLDGDSSRCACQLAALEMEAGALCAEGRCLDCHRCDELKEKG